LDVRADPALRTVLPAAPRGRVTAGYRSPEHSREVGYSRPLARGMKGNGGAEEEPTRAGLIEERQ
jgi:hypothetical protein